MKKILFLFAIAGMAIFQSCEGPEGPRGDAGPAAEVFEIQNVNFSFDDQGYNIYRTLTPNIFDSDVVMIYRLAGTIDSQTPIWEAMPETVQLGGGDEVYYDFDFSREDFTIYADANYDLEETPEFIDNQTFRIVIIPGYFSGSSNFRTTKPQYNTLVNSLGLTEADVKDFSSRK